MKFNPGYIIAFALGVLAFWIWSSQTRPDLSELHRRIQRGNNQLDSIQHLADSLRYSADFATFRADSLQLRSDSLQRVANKRPNFIEIHEEVNHWSDADRDQFWIDEAIRAVHTP